MYYVYQWFNINTFEVFYVGLGTGNRRFHTKQRNELFKKYYEENDCAVRIVRSNLSIEEGIQLERELISVLKPCCNISKGGDITNGKKISESLKGRTFSESHRKNLGKAAKLQWKENKTKIAEVNRKKVIVLDEEKNLIKEFDAKYHLGIWLHEELGYGKHWRSAQRQADKYFKSGELFDGKFFFKNAVDR